MIKALIIVYLIKKSISEKKDKDISKLQKDMTGIVVPGCSCLFMWLPLWVVPNNFATSENVKVIQTFT